MSTRHIDEILSQAEHATDEHATASSRLKSRIYSAMMLAEGAEGPIRSLRETEAEGRNLCVFEQIVRIAPAGESAQRYNYCRICHGRLLGERVENPPLYWNGCPYTQFKAG